MKPAIFTCYNHLIDEKIVDYQRKVVEKFTDIPLVSLKYGFTLDTMSHGDLLNHAVSKLFYYQGIDCVLILDIDAIPLSSEAVQKTFDLAYSGALVGNIQKANHLPTDKTYVAPSYMCFTRLLYEYAGSPTMNESNITDVGGRFSINCERFNIPMIKFLPVHSEAPVDDTGLMWGLGEGLPTYGHGTTFAHEGVPLTYHLFNSVRNTHNELFYKKCEELLAT